MDNFKIIEQYCLKDDLSSYDPYDIWKTSSGVKVKNLYYRNKYLGVLPAGLLTIYDLYLNNDLRVGYKKQEYPIVRAQAALALISLYKKVQKNIYMEYAKKHINWLIENSSKGYSGYCWGLNFNWAYSNGKVYDKNTPFSTHSPYPLEAIIEYYDVTSDETLREVIRSVFCFLENDIKIMKEDENLLIVSYGVERDRVVTNANSYVMYMYALLLRFFPEKKDYIEKKIKKIYQFLTSVQNADGSWLYQPYDESFIDCFHSAFVLKNIVKTTNLIPLFNSASVVENGYRYMLNNFLNQDAVLFKRFSIKNKISLVKFDLYDNAEMLNLALLLSDDNVSNKLHKSIQANFCKKNNIFSTIDMFSFSRNKNHLRWAVLPYLHALSNMENQ